MNWSRIIETYRWNIAVILLLVALLFISHYSLPQFYRFTSYLILFTIWMAWFVITSVQYFRGDHLKPQ